MADRALTGPRRLTMDIPAYQGSFTTLFPDDKGWRNQSLPNAIIYEAYFDLSGYELDNLTLVPQSTQLQDPGRYIYANFPPLPLPPAIDVEVLDIISQERLTLAEVDGYLAAGNVPGMSGTTEDFTQIVMGNYRMMEVSNTTSNVSLLTPITGGNFGSGEPTAAHKLWIYRIVRVNGLTTVGDALNIPASRFILIGTVVEEDDLPYLMRVKRSFELATQG